MNEDPSETDKLSFSKKNIQLKTEHAKKTSKETGSPNLRKYIRGPSTKRQFTVTREPKKTTFMSVTKLQIPNSVNKGYQRLDNSPLLKLESESDDELFLSSYGTPLANAAGKQVNQQLLKDGYRLDEMPDDEELDLIPPSEFRQGGICTCCNGYHVSCVIL